MAAFTDAENEYLIKHCAETFYRCAIKKDRLELLKDMERDMKRCGFSRFADEIQSRLNNMRQQYKAICKERAAGIEGTKDWKLFLALNKILSTKQ